MSISLYANYIISTGLSNAIILDIPPSIELRYAKYKVPKYTFNGIVENNSISTTSNGANKYFNSFYILTPAINKNLRFSLTYNEDFSDYSYVNWSNPIMSHYANNYETKYTQLTPQIGYKINNKLAISVGINFIKANPQFSIKNEPLYNVSMSGEGIDESLFFSISYRPTLALILSANYTTHNNIKVKGNANGAIMGNEMTSSGDIDIVLPREYTISSTMFFSKTFYTYLSYKQRYWQIYKTFDINFENSTYESLFGASLPKYYNAKHIYTIAFGKKFDNINISTYGGKSRGGHNIDNASVSVPVVDGSFLGANISYEISKKDTIGLQYTKYLLDKMAIKSSGFNGSFADTKANEIVFYYRKSF